MEQSNKQLAFLLFCGLFFGVWSAFPKGDGQHPKPEPVATDIEAAAAGAVKVYSLAMASEYRAAAVKLRSGEFKNLDDVNEALSKSIPAHRTEAFRPFGTLIDQVQEGNTEAEAAAMDEAATGFERAANAIK